MDMLVKALLQIDISPELRPNPQLFEGWMLPVFLLILINIAYVRISYERRLDRLFSSLLRIQILRQIMREELVFSHRASVLLFLNFCLAVALIAYSLLKYLELPLPLGGDWMGFSLITAAVAMLYLGKLALSRFFRWVFEDEGLIREYLFEVFLVNKAFGISAIPLALALAFLNVGNLWPIFLLAGLLALTAILFRLVQGMRMASAYRISPLYIILYLCTLEILPLLLIAKALHRSFV